MDTLTFKQSWCSSWSKSIGRRCGRTHVACNGGMHHVVMASFRLHIESTLALPNKVPELEAPIPSLPLAPAPSDGFKVFGGSKLSGHAFVSGAKNSALAILAGSLCSSEDVCLRKVPRLIDISKMLQVLKSVGVDVCQSGDDIHINARHVSSPEPCEESIQKIRAGFFVIGPLVARLGEAILSLPGGCAIGSRPIDLHLRGLEALGAKVEVRQGQVHAWVGGGGRKLKGGTFCLDFPSVGATETLMMAACLAEGNSVLRNVAQEPEVMDLANFLIACGAKIEGAGTSMITIEGVNKLHGAKYAIIPDRIEAGTFLIAAAITRSSIMVSPIVTDHLRAVIMKLRSIGCRFNQLNSNTLQIISSANLKNLDMATGPFPCFPTDLQPQMMSLAATCNGQSSIRETVFENRMNHVEELKKLGAQIRLSKNKAVIQGTSVLSGTHVKANDLRAGSALVLAGIAAEGVTIIEGASHVDRGYERFDEKLRLLGANIQRLP